MAETATLDAPTVADRVAAGAAWLDQRLPGWWRLIDLRQLDMWHSCRCVLGQLYGDYYTVQLQMAQAIALGFDAHLVTELDFAELQEEWTRVIEERRIEAGSAREVTGDGA